MRMVPSAGASGLFLPAFARSSARPRRPGSIHRIYLQTPAGMNNLAGYISNHLLPSLALSIFSPVSSSDLLSSPRVVKLAVLPSFPFPWRRGRRSVCGKDAEVTNGEAARTVTQRLAADPALPDRGGVVIRTCDGDQQRSDKFLAAAR